MSEISFSPGSIPTPPPGLNYIAIIQPSLNFLVIATLFSAMLVPILVALFLFSTPSLRTKPIFILNVISVLFGMVQGTLAIYGQVRYAQLLAKRAVLVITCLSRLAPFSYCQQQVRSTSHLRCQSSSVTCWPRQRLLFVWSPSIRRPAFLRHEG